MAAIAYQWDRNSNDILSSTYCCVKGHHDSQMYARHQSDIPPQPPAIGGRIFDNRATAVKGFDTNAKSAIGAPWYRSNCAPE